LEDHPIEAQPVNRVGELVPLGVIEPDRDRFPDLLAWGSAGQSIVEPAAEGVVLWVFAGFGAGGEARGCVRPEPEPASGDSLARSGTGPLGDGDFRVRREEKDQHSPTGGVARVPLGVSIGALERLLLRDREDPKRIELAASLEIGLAA